jgi:phosphotransferase system  glucose/maltose/N-acetylglucosamine-specific IIC component
MAIVGRGISLLANFLFLVFSALVAASAKWRRRLHFDLISMAVGGMIWMISILQTLLDHGDNPRFLVPLQVLVLYLVVRSLWFWSKGRVGLEDIDR